MPGGTLKKQQRQLLLQGLDLGGYRRLAGMELSGGPGEIALAGYGEKGAELVQFHAIRLS